MNDRNAVYPLPLDPGMSLHVSSDLMALQVQPVEDGGSPRLEVLGERPEQVAVDIRTGVGHVDVEIELDGVMGGWSRRDARLMLFVPRDLTGKFATEVGAITVRDLEPRDLTVSSEAGRIELRRVHGRLTLETEAGKITGEEIGGRLAVHSSAGKIDIEIDQLDAGEHRVHTEVGLVRVRLPRGLPVHVKASATLGTVINHVASVLGAAAVLVVNTNMGKVVVEEGGRERERDATPRVRIPVSSAARRPESGTHGGRTEPAPPAPATSRESGDRATETARILEMVAAGSLSSAEANDLLQALDHA